MAVGRRPMISGWSIIGGKEAMSNLPKKSLGQHWLYDKEALSMVCHAAEVEDGDVVLEIGPGLGTLTEVLLQKGARVEAVEYDKELIPKLRHKFSRYDNSRLRVEEADILEYDFSGLPPGYKVAANIPYYLTSNLLRRLCETANPFSRAALLVQKEVAERVVAMPGEMSLLSVSVQLYCEASLGPIVPASLFDPPPKVDSQILVLQHRGGVQFNDIVPKEFFRLVKAGFSERRKKLRSSLSGGLHISKAEAEVLLGRAGIDPNLRAQALALQDWHNIYKIFALGPGKV